MGKQTLLERLPDKRRIIVMLRANGASYEEIAVYLGINHRQVRRELESVADSFPGLLDYGRDDSRNRLLRLVYLLGLSDAGVSSADMPDYLDALVTRSDMLMERMSRRSALDKILQDKR